jgi:hypothetical protein
MNFKQLFTGFMTAATLSVGMLASSSAFAQEAPTTKLCRDKVTQEWLYYNEANKAGVTKGYDCNGIDANGYDKSGVVILTNPADKPNPSKGTCVDSKGAWIYGVDGFDCNGFDAVGKGRDHVIVKPPVDTTPKDMCRDMTTGAWKYDTSGFDCNGFDRYGKTKTAIINQPPAKCEVSNIPWEYTKQTINGKEYNLDRNGYTYDGYSPANNTWYTATPEDGKKCEPEGMAKPVTEMKKEEKSREGRPGKLKKRIMWKDGRPVAPAPAKY